MTVSTLTATDEVLIYINTQLPFAKAICLKLREIILKAVPGIKEDWKWGPNYNSNGMVCGFGGFQKHVKFTFYNGSAMKDNAQLFNHCVDNDFNRSIKYTDVSEIDEQALTAYLKESAEVNKKGFKRAIKDKTIEIPAELQEALKKDKAASNFFINLSYGYKKEYAEYIDTAKQEKTRNERIAKVVAMCAEGISLNDKYKKK